MARSTSPDAITLRSRFWMNLHLVICRQTGIGARFGRAERPPDPLLEDVSLLTSGEREAWQAALAAYAAVFDGRGLHDPVVAAITMRLAPLADADDVQTASIAPPIRDVLARAAPVYLRHWWPAHQCANQAWIDATQPLLAQFGPALLPRIERAFQAGKLRLPIDVDVTTYVGWSGAGTLHYPPFPDHITIDSTMTSNQSWSGLEIVLHEVAHTLVSPVSGPLVEGIAQHSAARGQEPPRDLWHVVLFYTVGELVRQALVTHGVSYTPYADAQQLYALPHWRGFRDALAEHWQRYLDGEIGYDAALGLVVAAVQGST
jgi:hypothetical protein